MGNAGFISSTVVREAERQPFCMAHRSRTSQQYCKQTLGVVAFRGLGVRGLGVQWFGGSGFRCRVLGFRVLVF